MYRHIIITVHGNRAPKKKELLEALAKKFPSHVLQTVPSATGKFSIIKASQDGSMAGNKFTPVGQPVSKMQSMNVTSGMAQKNRHENHG